MSSPSCLLLVFNEDWAEGNDGTIMFLIISLLLLWLLVIKNFNEHKDTFFLPKQLSRSSTSVCKELNCSKALSIQ